MKRIAAWLLCLALAVLCAQAAAEQDVGTEKNRTTLKIAAASDLHVNPAFRYTNIVNPLEPYHLQIVDAFLWDAVNRGADVVLLLGDITNQGRMSQHEALIEKLRAAQKQGVTVIVLPGNHDIGEVSTDRFAELYTGLWLWTGAQPGCRVAELQRGAGQSDAPAAGYKRLCRADERRLFEG